MPPRPASSDPVTLAVRWLARGLSLLAAGAVMLFLVGEGKFERFHPSGTEAAQLILFGTAWLGLLVGWRWELPGAAMTLGGIALFYCVEFLAAGHFPRGWAFAAIALPGALFLWSGLRVPAPEPRHLIGR